MPVGTVTQELIHKDLKSLPPDGFVKLKQLSFDQLLERRDKAMKMKMEAKQNRKKSDKALIEFESAMQWARFFEFSNCIADHNIQDDQGQLLNFSNPITLKILDPKVGAEIEKYIEELNMDEEDDDAFF